MQIFGTQPVGSRITHAETRTNTPLSLLNGAHPAQPSSQGATVPCRDADELPRLDFLTQIIPLIITISSTVWPAIKIKTREPSSAQPRFQVGWASVKSSE